MSALEDIFYRGQARRRLRADPDGARLVRLRAGLTQAEVAELVGVNRATIGRWESGHCLPRGQALERYTDILKRLEVLSP